MVACKIITKADVETVLHVSVDAPTPIAADTEHSGWGCAYGRPGGGAVADVVVSIGSPSMLNDAIHRAQSAGYVVTPVAGLGEKAFFMRGHSNLLDVYAKGYVVSINTDIADLDLVKALAKRAIARL